MCDLSLKMRSQSKNETRFALLEGQALFQSPGGGEAGIYIRTEGCGKREPGAPQGSRRDAAARILQIHPPEVRENQRRQPDRKRFPVKRFSSCPCGAAKFQLGPKAIVAVKLTFVIAADAANAA